jgi:cellulose synthase operon protein C
MKRIRIPNSLSVFSLVMGFAVSAIPAVYAADANNNGAIVPVDPKLQDELLQSRATRQSNILQDDIPDTKALEQPASATSRPRVVESNPVTEATGREELRLWQWMRMSEYDKVDSKIQELQGLYPSWKPPAKMVELLADARSKKNLDRAVATKNWQAVRQMAQQQPGFFNCAKFYNLWTLADAYHASGDDASVQQVYDDMMNNCRAEDVRMNTFRRAQQQLTADQLEAMLQREQQRTVNRLSKNSLAQLEKDMTRARVLIASREGKDEVVLDAIPSLSKEVIASKDAGFALIFGWAEYRAENLAEAERWFNLAHTWKPSPESIQAMATMYGRQGKLDEAESLARTDLHDPLMRDMLAGILAQRAQKAFDEEDYEATIKYFDEAEQYAPRSLDNEAVYGWSAYHLGDMDKAAKSFEKAYKDDPQPEIAEGLYYSLKETDTARLERTAREEKGPLQQILEVRAGEEAYNSGQYHAAYAESPKNYPGLSGINSPAFLGGLLFHFRSGESGLSQLDTQRVPILTVEGGYRRNLMSLELSGISLSSGNLTDSAVIGNYPGIDQSYSYESTTEVNNGTELLFRYHYEGRVSPFFSIGLTPSNGPLSARTMGDLGLNYTMKRGSLKVEGFRHPVKESILSYTGIYDPYTGLAWGGVDSTGFLANSYLMLNEGMGATVNIKSANLTGTQVADNKMLEFSVGAKKIWTDEDWDELTLGPDFTFQRFEENLSKFTYGHGGYFSPQQLFKYGGTATAVSKEMQDFVTAAKLNFGYQQHKSNCAALKPLISNNCSELYPQSTGAGVYFGMELVGMVQADKNAQIGGGMFYSMSPEFNEFGFMLAVRLTLEPRKSVLRADLPDWLSRIHD